MPLNTRLSDLLQYMQQIQFTFRDRLSAEERDRTGSEQHWSAKDNLFHIGYWANFHLDNIESFAREGVWPKREDGGDFDKTNAVVFARYRDNTWDEAHAMIQDAYARGQAYLAQASEDALLALMPTEPTRQVWRYLAGNYVVHPMIHLWEYLNQNGHAGAVKELFGEPFAAQLLALSDDDPWQGTTLYNLACIDALSGDTAAALDRLREALQLVPDLVEWSKEDPDLASLRGEPGYQALYE